jgi:hypothetical protein
MQTRTHEPVIADLFSAIEKRQVRQVLAVYCAVAGCGWPRAACRRAVPVGRS